MRCLLSVTRRLAYPRVTMYAALAVALLGLGPGVHAQTVTVTISPASVVKPAGETKTSVFTVTNTGSTSATYTLTITCTPTVTSCTGPSSVGPVSAGASTTATVTYVIGANGTSGTVTLKAANGAQNSSATQTIVGASPGLTVVAQGGSSVTKAAGTTNTQDYTVTNTGAELRTVTFTPTCTSTLQSCSVSPASLDVNGQQAVTATVTYTTQTTAPVSGTVTLGAATFQVSASAPVTVSIVPPAVAVSPASSSVSKAAGSAQTQAYTISNTGTATSTYTAAVACVNLTGCSVSPTSVTIAGGGTASVTASYTTGAVGTADTLKMTASTPGASAVGTLVVTPTSATAVSVTPKGTTVTWPSWTFPTQNYTVTNTGSSSATFTIVKSCGGAFVTCTAQGGTTTQTIAAGASATIGFTFETHGPPPGTGWVQLKASSGSVADSATTNVNAVAPGGSVAISPSSVSKPASGAQSSTFTVTNSGTATSTYTLAVVCTGSLTACSVPAPTSVTIAAGGSASVPVSYTTGAAGSTGTIQLTASTPNITPNATLTVTAATTTAVAVTPKNGTGTLGPNTTGNTYTFTVQNTGTATTTFTLAGSCASAVTCSAYSNSVSLAAGASTTVPITYATAANNTGANLTGTIMLKATAGAVADSAIYTVTVTPTPPVVAVTPKNGTTTLNTNVTGQSFTFTVANTSTSTAATSFTLTGTCAGSVSCTAYSNTASLAGGASTTVPITFATTGTAGTGTIKLKAVGGGVSDSATYTVTVNAPATAGVTVTPKGQTVTWPSWTFPTQNYIVTNTGSSSATFTIVKSCGGAFVTCTAQGGTTSQTIAAGASATIGFTFETHGPPPGTGWVQLKASSGSVADSATTNVNAVAPGGSVAISPSSVTKPASGAQSSTFTVNNTGTATSTYTLTVACTGALTACSVPAPTSATIAAGGTASVPVNYTTGVAGTTGTVVLTAATPNITPSATLSVTAATTAAVAVTPKGTSTTLGPNTTGNSFTFTVQNTGAATTTYTLTGTCASAVSCSAYSNSVSLAAGASTTVPITFATGANNGASNLTGTVTLSASSGGVTDAATYTVTVTPAPPAVAVTPKNQSTTIQPNSSGNTFTFTVANTSTSTVATSFTLAGSCSAPVTCSTYSNTVSLAGGQQTTVPITFASSASTGSGGVNLTATGGGVSDAATYGVTVAPLYGVSITPKNQSIALPINTTGNVASFDVTNTGTATSTFTVNWTCSYGVSCTTASTSVTLTGGAKATIPITYATTDEGAGAQIDIWARSAQAQDQTVLRVTVAPPTNATVWVTPKNTSMTLQSGTFQTSQIFWIQNNSPAGTPPVVYTLNATCSGAVSCSYATNTVSVAAGQWQNTIVFIYPNTAPVGSSAPGTVQLTASGGGNTNAGTLNITVTGPPIGGVAVTPKYRSNSLAGGVSTSANFTVTNTSAAGSAAKNLHITINCWGGASCTTDAKDVSVIGGQSTNVNVPFTTVAGMGQGVVSVGAVDGVGGGEGAVYAIDVGVAGPGVAVSPKGSTISVPGGTPATTQNFYVLNTAPSGSAAVTFNLSGSCSGAVNCNAYTGSVSLAGGQQSNAIPITYSASNNTTGSPLAGSVQLSASGGGVSDQAAVSVSVSPTGGASGVTVVARALGLDGSVARDACLDMPLGKGASYECADLRVAYSLPAITTMNKSRQPTLLYLSSHANATAEIVADVSLQTGLNPTQITPILSIQAPGKTPITLPAITWDPSTAAGTPRRITVPVDGVAMGLATGAYHYTLQVSETSGSVTKQGQDTGTVVIINRVTSEFGRGWWLEGYEQLITGPDAGNFLWIGGDGSTRVFSPTTDPNTFVVKSPLNRPETLTKTAQGTFKRLLPNGAFTAFDAGGLHDSTVNSLGQVTRFIRSGGRLSSIVLPVPAGMTAPGYTFTSQSNPDNTNVTRLAKVSMTGPGVADQPTYITPDATGWISTIEFLRQNVDTGYASSGATTAFTYSPAAASRDLTNIRDPDNHDIHIGWELGKLRADTIPMASPALPIINTFCPAETRGRSTCSGQAELLGNTYTLLDGPRSDADYTKFYVNRFGAPDTVVNALNATSRFIRDLTFPLLAKSIIKPNGLTTNVTINSRGLPDAVTVVNPLGPTTTGDATTTFAWHPTWDMPVTVTTPTNDQNFFQYSSSRPLPTQHWNGRDWSIIDYDANWRVKTIYLQSNGNAPDGTGIQMGYDPTLGNLQTVTSRMGTQQSIVRDAIGRILTRQTPIDGSGAQQTSTTYYYASGLPYRQLSDGPSMAPAATENVTIENVFSRAGLQLSLKRTFSPRCSVCSGPYTPPVMQWTYDNAGRKLTELGSDGLTESFVYDVAGNVTSWFPKPRAEFAGAVTMQYDVLNRLTKRTVPSVPIPETAPNAVFPGNIPGDMQQGGNYLNNYAGKGQLAPFFQKGYPQYPNVANYTGYVTPLDVSDFTYDDATNDLLTANNVDGRISRTYYRNGQLRTERQQIASLNGTDFSRHIYDLQYIYDLSGRRRELIHPSQLSAGAARDRTSWTYEANTGWLSTVTDIQGSLIAYSYFDDGSLQSIVRAGTSGEGMTYDRDGRLTNNSVYRASSSTPQAPWLRNGQDLWTFRQEDLTYDLRDKLLQVTSTAGLATTRILKYSGLGYLISSSFSGEQLRYGCCTPNFTINETFINDGLGNIDRHKVTEDEGTADAPGMSWNPFTLNVQNQWNNGIVTEDLQEVYDPAVRISSTLHLNNGIEDKYIFNGVNRVWMSQLQLGANGVRMRDERASYYTADGKLRADDHRKMPDDLKALYDAVFEEYRYDALGRRTWVRSRTWCQGGYEANALCRLNKVRRVVWDGTSELYEIQMPDSTTDPAFDFENDATPLPRMEPFEDNSMSAPANQLRIDPGRLFGRVAYTQGVGIDAPISVVRFDYVSAMDGYRYGVWLPNKYTYEIRHDPFTLFPLWNTQGKAEIGVVADGGATVCKTSLEAYQFTNCVDVFWPRFFNAYQNETGFGLRTSWLGSLIEEKRDASGLMYRRNRMYDPATGQFTQEDPTGPAGGVNLYGYTGGDPINHSDPFGTCRVLLRFTPVIHGSHSYLVTADNTRVLGFRGGPATDNTSSQVSQVSQMSGGSASDRATSGSSRSESSGSSNMSSPGSSRAGGAYGAWGPLEAEANKPLDGSFHDYHNGEMQLQKSLLSNNEPCDKINASFAETADLINKAAIPYNPLRTNSNAVVSEMLRRAGIVANPGTIVHGWGTRLIP